MTLTIVLDKKTRLVTEPQVQFIGVPSGDIDPESLNRDLSHATEEILQEMSSRTLQSDDSLRAALQRVGCACSPVARREAETTRESGKNLTPIPPIKSTRSDLWFLAAKMGGGSGSGLMFVG